MKTIPVSLILAGILAPSSVVAEAQNPERRKMKPDGHDKREMQQPFAEAWKAADKNGDGFITRDEFSTMPRIQKISENKHQKLFERLDKDADGKLEKDDLRQLGSNHNGPPPAMKRLWELDTDGSGGVSLAEFKVGEFFQKLTPERQLEIFQRIDTDGDGMITQRDRPQNTFKAAGLPDRQNRGPKPKNPAQQIHSRAIIRQLDQDGDGSLSFEEFLVSPPIRALSEDEQEDRFETLDRDGDQKITSADFPQDAPPQEPKGN